MYFLHFPKLLGRCGVCGGEIKFGRIQSVAGYLITRQKIWGLTQDVEMINDIKARLNWSDKWRSVERDVMTHNLWANIKKKLILERLLKQLTG